MQDKFSYYDLIAHIVPGTLLLLLILILWNLLDVKIPLQLSAPSELAIGVVAAFAIGNVVQAISSYFESFYYWLWRGKPSVIMLSRETVFFSDSQRVRVLETLKGHFGIKEQPKTNNDYQFIFNRCMILANSSQNKDRIEAFNSSYAFSRALLTTSLLSSVIFLIILVLYWQSVLDIQSSAVSGLLFLLIIAGLVTMVEFLRTRERAYHYVKEVIYTALDVINPARS